MELPVDTHVWRISIRLGLIGKKVTADAAHNLLQALLPSDARAIYNFHKALLRHGQRICVFERPRCEKCPITDLCDYYQTCKRQEESEPSATVKLSHLHSNQAVRTESPASVNSGESESSPLP